MKTRRITQLGLALVVILTWISIGHAVGHEIEVVAPNGLENTEGFADNTGPDELLVFDGPLSILYPATGPAEGPRPFSEGAKFQTPFFYDPSLGNLLVDFTATCRVLAESAEGSCK